MSRMREELGTVHRTASSLVVRTIGVPVRNLAPALVGLRVVHLTDFHFRSWTRVAQDAQDALLGLDYDILAVTGDFCARRRRWKIAAENAKRFFEPIIDRAPVYAVLGNHDHHHIAKTDIPIRFLMNESVRVEHDGDFVEVVGVNQSTPCTENLDIALRDERPRGACVLLAHYPSTIYRLPPDRIDIQLSGHTHGGQIRLPWLGCLWANDRIPTGLARGLHAVDGTYLHVSPGIGVSPPIPIRFNCPPEITVLTLRSADSSSSKAGPKSSRAPVAALGSGSV